MNEHEHTNAQRIAIPVVPAPGEKRSRIDDVRLSKNLEPFDYGQQRYILARQYGDGCMEAYDLVNELPRKGGDDGTST
jgi:hypothetical protein